MIVGFNTNIKQGNQVYHVQTEDKGLDNPLIESLVYVGGAIIDTKRTEYGAMLKEGFDEAKILKMMEVQHRQVIAEIKKGKYDADKPPEEEVECILDMIAKSPRTLDEVVSDWLAHEMQQDKLDLILASRDEFISGADARIKVKALAGITRRGIDGAKIFIHLVSSGGEERKLHEGETDENGELDVILAIPSDNGKKSVVVIRGDSEVGSAEIKQLVKESR